MDYRRQAGWLLAVVVLSLMCCHAEEAAKAPSTLNVRVDEKSVLRSFSPRFFGLNFEWGYSQDRVQVDPSNHLEDSQLAELCQGLPLPLNRMAGTISQEFHWKQAIGPVEDRPLQQLNPWESPRQVRIGPVEWIRWVQKIDPRAEFVWTLNILKETPQDAADLVQFLTGDAKAKVEPGKTNWAQKRVELGLPNPVPVACWELGNEMSLKPNAHKKYVWTAEQYIEAVKPFIAAIRAVNPKAKLAIEGSCYWDEWDGKVLRALGSQVDYIAPHYYYKSAARGKDDPSLKPGSFQGLEGAFVDSWLKAMVKQVREVETNGHKVSLLITEHAMWPPALKDQEWKSTWYLSHSLDGVLSTASFLVRCLAVPEVAGTNYHNFSSGPWGLVYRSGQTNELYKTGMLELFRLLGGIEPGEVVTVETSVGEGAASATDRPVAMSAIRHAKGMTLILVNPGAARTLNLTFAGSHVFQGASGIWGNDLDAHNTKDAVVLKIEPLACGVKGKPLEKMTLPAQSLVVARFE
ncbi:MAG: hypothetical protein B9S32_09250 [Verrucomicrobia bacterium Tous-C9LFEB]|nr:MAG: hypothetical protein B9S32_09250 [Verrucomicrobia bacterium Tous-C9LFEB]